MAAFRDDEDNALDWGILLWGGISLYRSRKYLDEDLQWLQLRGYRIYNIDCKTWVSDDSVHDSLQETLSFPAYYGRNYNALDDCLGDLEVPDDGGLAIVLNSYHVYAGGPGSAGRHSGRQSAEMILHLLAGASRYFLLRGRRFIILVQSDDPSMHFQDLAGVTTQWNWREWLNKDRGL